jgi:hypothetical protein
MIKMTRCLLTLWMDCLLPLTFFSPFDESSLVDMYRRPYHTIIIVVLLYVHFLIMFYV